MKIAVCFKTIAEYESMAARDWVVQEGNRVDTSFVRRLFNCYEESALEMGLRLKEQTAGEHGFPKLTALTIDDHRADLFIRQLLSVGYEHGVRIGVGEEVDCRFNPLAISGLIHAYHTTFDKQDLILFGSNGGEGENGQTGPMMAERLGWPCISNVVDVSAVDRDVIRVTCKEEGLTTTLKIRIPAILVVTNTTIVPFLRIPTLQQKLSSKKKEIRYLGIEDLQPEIEASVSSVRLTKLEATRRDQKNCRMVAGKDAREKACELYRLLQREYLP